MSNPCAVCQAPSQQRCAMCKNVHYCSKEHQIQHWKKHKQECSCYKVAESEKFGRYVVATRNISAGEVIMKENPLVIGPKVVSFPLCLGCHRSIKATSPDDETPLSFYYCPDCGWPLCAPRCKNSNSHQAECKLMKGKYFQSQITYQTAPKKESAYCTILPLRCLRLEPNKLKTLLSLESHLEDRRNTALYKLLKVNVVGFIRNCLGLKEFDEETILNVAGILDTNAFEIRRSAGNIKVRGLYPQAAMLSHDCRPNTKHNFVGDDFTLVLTATQDIKKGDTITATYTQTLWGTHARRAHLQESKCFNCTCERCSDPFEFDTYLSCILCSKCRGYVVCNDPLDMTSDWACQNCGHKITGRQMLRGNESFKKELEGIDKSVGELESLIERYLKVPSVFHDRNYHIVQAKYALTQLYGNMLTGEVLVNKMA